MKTIGVTCSSLLLLLCSLAALYRYWLIMAICVGFAGVGDDRFLTAAHISLLVGITGVILSLTAALGYLMLSRRKVLPEAANAVGAADLRVV